MVNFKRAQKLTKDNIQKVPNSTAIIYKIKNPVGRNLYTGIAGRGKAQKRLLDHKELKKEIIPGGTRFQIAQVKNKEIARKIEKQIIKKEQPKFNDQGK